MPDIVLSTLNAKYIHTAFGLRYLLANLGALRSRTRLLEFDLQQRPLEIAERILNEQPRIVGLGVYIWNVVPITQLVAILKQLRPQLPVVLGGPEVSHELDTQPVVRMADHVIVGEADLAFAALCDLLLAGAPPGPKVIRAPLPDLEQIRLPYEEYTDADVAHRVVYVEASRGCPFACEFCLSSLDVGVRQVPLEALLASFDRLLKQGVRLFKFVDRTFNLNWEIARSLLHFFHEHYRPGLFLHFEMIPDRLPAALREWIVRFPPGALQLEIGIQSFNAEVGRRINRRQNLERTEENLRFLRRETGVHLHADLIAGLPGESLDSFAAGFDRLLALDPHEIQVGILKRLRGTPIVRHDAEWGMVYSPDPPYEILQSHTLDFFTLQRLRRFARFWDLVGNSGNFEQTRALIWAEQPSPFFAFLRWSDWIHRRTGCQHGIALVRLAQLLFDYLTRERALDSEIVRSALVSDFTRLDREPPPLPGSAGFGKPATPARTSRPDKRQRRHQHPIQSPAGERTW
jgi:radical SAM superfamily enzyme YgiQ (UPF0313 family)